VDDQPATLEDSGAPKFRIVPAVTADTAPRFRISPAFTRDAASSGISGSAFVIVGDDAGEGASVSVIPLSAK
jgi:hypothetical protein